MEYRFLWAPVVIFVVGLLLLRIAGKRAVANMSNFDLFLVSSLGSSLGGFITDPDSLGRTFVGVGLLVATYLGFAMLMLNNKARRMLSPKPSVLVHKGHINERGLRDSRMTVAELLGHLRIKGYPVVGDVEFAIMEEAGEISVIPKQPKKLRMVPVVIDGDWIDDNLQEVNTSKPYVFAELAKQGVQPNRVRDLTLVTVDEKGTVWYDAQDKGKNGKKPPKQYESLEQAMTGVLSSQAQRITEENNVEK